MRDDVEVVEAQVGDGGFIHLEEESQPLDGVFVRFNVDAEIADGVSLPVERAAEPAELCAAAADALKPFLAPHVEVGLQLDGLVFKGLAVAHPFVESVEGEYNSGTVLLLHYLLPGFWLMHFLRLIPNLMERGLSYQFKRVGILQSVVVASHDVPHSNVKLQLI